MYTTSSATKAAGDVQNVHTLDLRSDTLSKPSAEMRQAMLAAEVGDDVYGEDPTVAELERKSAALFGKEAALFVPSGTMGNLISVMVHCNKRGSEVILGESSHVFLYEQGGAASIAGVQLATIPNNPDGTFSLERLERKIRYTDDHEPTTQLVIVENTHNMCGGKVLPLQWLQQLAKICKKDNSIALHMDGARVFNAAAALNVTVDEIAKDFDSVSFCLSKGLTAPVGSVLVGSKDFITKARRTRKALGGGMRQAGILAAAGIFALDEVVPRLSEDHRKTLLLAEKIRAIQSPNFQVDIKNLHSNILLVNLVTDRLKSADLVQRLAKVTPAELDAGVMTEDGKGVVVRLSGRDWKYCRAVLYQEISDKDIEVAAKKIEFVLREFDTLLATF